MTTHPEYSNGYDDGYRAGLQKARDAIREGKLATREQMDELRAGLHQTAAELDAQLQVLARTGNATALIDAVTDTVARLKKDLPS